MTSDCSALLDATFPESEVFHVVQILAPLVAPGVWIFLEGDLGAGKTTLARALLSALGAADSTQSPTFSLLNVVSLAAPLASTQAAQPASQSEPHTGGKGALRRILHLDLYRLKKGTELHYLGLEEEFRSQTAAVFEWASQVTGDDWEEFFQATGCRRPSRLLLLEIKRAQSPSELNEECRRYVLRDAALDFSLMQRL